MVQIMDNRMIDDATIREYLLGRIGAENELSAQFDERMLADPEFSLRIDVIEDEILDDYVDGVLTAADVEAVENYFLLPPERQLKLRGTRLISQGLKVAAARTSIASSAAPAPDGSSERGRVIGFSSLRTWTEIAAGIVFVACTLYFWNQQRELRQTVKQSRQELAQWKQAQEVGSVAANQAAMVTLNLVVPGLSRGDQSLPEAHLTAGAATLRISIALTAPPAGRLRVRLMQGAAMVWSREDVEARPVTGGAVLTVDVPATAVPEGACRLIVGMPGQGEPSYWFRVTKA